MKGKVDMRQLKQFEKRIKRMSENAEQQCIELILKEAAQVLFAKVVKRTPVGKKPKHIDGYAIKHLSETDQAQFNAVWAGYQGGMLRKAWEISKVKYAFGHYQIEIYNIEPYAEYVEYGHRGVFIPILGVTLHVDTHWTEGKFMMTTSEDEMERILPKIAKKTMDKFLKEGLSGK